MKINDNGKVRNMTKAEVAEYEAFLASPEYKAAQVRALKDELAETDYKAIKFAEGWLTEEEYAPIKAQRQALRDKINELEG